MLICEAATPRFPWEKHVIGRKLNIVELGICENNLKSAEGSWALPFVGCAHYCKFLIYVQTSHGSILHPYG